MLRLGQHLVRALTPPPIELAELHLKPLTESPEHAGDALATLAELRQKSGRLEEARAHAARSVELMPEEPAGRLMLERIEGALRGAK